MPILPTNGIPVNPGHAEPRDHSAEGRAAYLAHLRAIVQLAEKDRVPMEGDTEEGYCWGITGDEGAETAVTLEDAFELPYVTAEDLRPLLPALRKVVAKLKARGEMRVYQFIETGNLDELEQFRRGK